MKKIPNVFLVGPMGGGKTSIGKILSEKLQLTFYDSDLEIEARTGADIAWIFDVEGEAGFRKREEKVIQELSQLSHIVLSTGGGAILSQENRNALAARGTVIYLSASIEQQHARTNRNNKKRPLLQTDDPRGVLEDLAEEREPLYREIADAEFSTDNSTVAKIASDILDHLRANPLAGGGTGEL